LLLDEPLGALDLKLRKAMQFELKQLNRETGATFIYVTHDQEEALTMSDRIAVMNEGRLLQVGSPAEIYEEPADRFVADFIGQSNLIPGVLVERDGAFCSVRIGNGVVLTARLGGDAQVDDDVEVSIRPERVQVLTTGAESAVNVVRSLVREIVYLGNRHQAITELSADVRLVIDLPAGLGATPGDTLTVSLPARHTTCFPAGFIP
jgi:spermidine/putrescine transport system ATP-binding protein